MDDAILKDYQRLAREIGETTSGLGSLLLEYDTPWAALQAPERRLAELPVSTQRALHRARRRFRHTSAIYGKECDDHFGKKGGKKGGKNPDNTLDNNHGNKHGNKHGKHPARRHDRRSLQSREFTGDRERAFLVITHPAYPALLKAVPDPPPWLFVAGDLSCLKRPAVAIVGSRNASAAGLHLTRALARTLAERGYLVCSGLALGIDTAAHEGALERGRTAAVLASGLDRRSPRRNLALADRICEAGCLVTELPDGTTPNRGRFPRRNRIISGLCTATIIVEAALPSGTLHTAHAAAEQGRDVYVLPWSLVHPGGRGCLRLLRDGAIPITDLDDLDDFFPASDTSATGSSGGAPSADPGVSSDSVTAAERRILGLIGDSALTPEEIQALSDLDATSAMQCLTDLELRGFIARRNGRYLLYTAATKATGKA